MGTSTKLSFNALMALVIGASIGQLRPCLLKADVVAYQAYFELLCRSESFDPDAVGLDFNGILVTQDDYIPPGTIIAYEHYRDEYKELGRLTGIRS